MENSNINSISKQQMIDAVSSHEVFIGLDKISLQQLSSILDYKRIQKNKRVFEVGDQPNLIFYLLSGSLTLKFPDNTKLELQPGELIGEIGVLNGDFRLGSLVAKEDSQLISICGTSLFNPDIIPAAMSLQIVRNLSKRVTNYLRSIQQTSTREIIIKGENEHVEFKSTLRWNIKAQKKDPRITHAVLKTIAAFLNTEGGILLVGVTDDGEINGLHDDKFENHDKLFLFLTNIIKSKLGTFQMDKIHFHIESVDGQEVLRIDVQAAVNPCYLITEKLDHFYIRTGPSTTDLRLSKVYAYVTKRFNTKSADNEN
jgi:CRP-like cAMP-binding protein